MVQRARRGIVVVTSRRDSSGAFPFGAEAGLPMIRVIIHETEQDWTIEMPVRQHNGTCRLKRLLTRRKDF